jgi:hypothetical protein
MWQHGFLLPIKTTWLSSANQNKQKLCWFSIRIPVVGFRDNFILAHLMQIKVTTKFIKINNKNSMKNDSFVEPDLTGPYSKSFLK